MGLIDTLKALATTVRNEKKKEANTSVRIGDLFLGIIDFFNTKADNDDLKLLENKIDNLESFKKGYFPSYADLIAKYPVPSKGWYAYLGSSGTIWVEDTGFWADSTKPIPEELIQLDEYAKKTTEEGVVVRTEDGKMPSGILTASIGADLSDYIQSGSEFRLDRFSGALISDTAYIYRSFVYMLPLEIGVYTLSADFANAGNEGLKVFFIYNESGGVVQRLTSSNIINNTITFNISQKGFLSFYLYHEEQISGSDNWKYDISRMYEFVGDNLKLSHRVRFPDNTITSLSNIDNMIYAGEIEGKKKDITALMLDSVVKSTDWYISSRTGALEYYNSGGDIKMEYISKYELKSGTKVEITADILETPPEEIANVFLMKQPEILLRKYTLTSETLEIVANEDCYLRFYTFYNGGTEQPANRYDIRNTLNVQLTAKTAIVGYAKEKKEGKISLNNEIIGESIAIEKNIIAYPSSKASGSFMAYNDERVKSMINKEPLEANTDYIIDLGKKYTIVKDSTPVYLYEASPWNITANASTNVAAKIVLNQAGRRYITFSTKHLPHIKYVGMQYASHNWENSGFVDNSDISLKKVSEGNVLLFGNEKIGSKQLRIDHSNDSVIDIPFPKWCNVNVIGYNLDIRDKVNRVRTIIEYEDSNGHYFKGVGGTARQGTSTVNEAKMPLKTKLETFYGDKLNIRFDNHTPRASWHLKSTPFESTSLKNSAMYNIIKDHLYARRPFHKRYPNSQAIDQTTADYRARFNFEPLWIPKGIPCRLYMAGCFFGKYFLNYNDFCENYGVFESDVDAFIYKGASNFNTTDLSGNWDKWEELKTDTYMTPDLMAGEKLWDDDTKQPLLTLNQWLYSANSETFKKEYEQYFDLDWQIEYFLMCYLADLNDNLHNNIVLLTYDRQKFYSMFRDCDTWAGNGVNHINRAYNADTIDWAKDCRLWNKFYSSFKEQIHAKYAELRNDGTFSVETFEKELLRIDQFNYDHHLMDLYSWQYRTTDVPTFRGSIGQILDFIDKRLRLYLDVKFGYSD